MQQSEYRQSNKYFKYNYSIQSTNLLLHRSQKLKFKNFNTILLQATKAKKKTSLCNSKIASNAKIFITKKKKAYFNTSRSIQSPTDVSRTVHDNSISQRISPTVTLNSKLRNKVSSIEQNWAITQNFVNQLSFSKMLTEKAKKKKTKTKSEDKLLNQLLFGLQNLLIFQELL